MSGRSKWTFIEHAAQLAINSQLKQRVGCIAVYRGKIVATGYNTSYEVSSKNPYKTIYQHAECCVLNLPDLRGVDIYVTRLLQDGSLTMAKPCAICVNILKQKRIKRIYYTDFDGSLRSCKGAELANEHVSYRYRHVDLGTGKH